MLSIIVSDLLLSSIGVVIDVMGIGRLVGTSVEGPTLKRSLCQFEGFFYMTFGKSRYLDIRSTSIQFYFTINKSKTYSDNKNYEIDIIAGMASLYSTVSFAIVRLIIVKTKPTLWLGPSTVSLEATRALQLICLFVLTFSIPPLIGYGRYDNEMFGIR